MVPLSPTDGVLTRRMISRCASEPQTWEVARFVTNLSIPYLLTTSALASSPLVPSLKLPATKLQIAALAWKLTVPAPTHACQVGAHVGVVKQDHQQGSQGVAA